MKRLPDVHKFYEIALHVGLKCVMVYAHLVEIPSIYLLYYGE